ncbi:MAG: CBS domain-containing protein [Ardenticatenaceae bacterium]|nr:CBS domain-containing protein [Ardenticatenaceae bacterium]MCB9446463.1 CBS domain-containing protein [Ardenticatenaceae bacterium]
MSQELVKDWMSKEVITIDVDTCCLPKAHRLMTDNNIRRLPVVDKNGRLVGIVTRGDIRGAQPSQATSLSIWELNYLLANLKIADIMTSNPVTVSENSTIGEAADIMLANKVSGLPVLNDAGQLAGIITESDIFRMVVRHEWGAKEPAT